MTGSDFRIRRAELADVDQIADAHLDSIHSLGARHYPPDVVRTWTAGLKGDFYVPFMKAGEVFFIALGDIAGEPKVMGFSSHQLDGDTHRVSVYVRGYAARKGIGSALLRAAESSAVAAGGTSLHIHASFAGVQFYEANGFEKICQDDVELVSGVKMACVVMRKDLHTQPTD